MNYGFVKVAAAVPHIQVADCFYNIEKIEGLMRQASEKGVQIIAFPELSVTAYTCLDLFAQQTLLDGAETALLQLVSNTADLNILAIVGVPLRTGNQLINAAVVFQKGVIRGVVPKTYLPNYKEFQEQRWFTSATELRTSTISIGEEEYPMGSHLLFRSGQLTIGIEICEDLWVPVPPSSLLAMEGANIIFNLSASNELIGKPPVAWQAMSTPLPASANQAPTSSLLVTGSSPRMATCLPSLPASRWKNNLSSARSI